MSEDERGVNEKMCRRNYKIILLAMIMLLSFQSTVYAKGEEKGSIRISLSDGSAGTAKKGVVFAYEKVADLVDGRYKESAGYSSGIDFNGMKTARQLELAAAQMKKLVKIPDGLVKTEENGIVEIQNLETGMYLVYVSNQANYETIDPFLVSIPTWDEKEKAMKYHVEVIPKHEPLPKKTPEAPQTNLNSSYDKWFAISVGSIVIGLLALCVNNRKINEK